VPTLLMHEVNSPFVLFQFCEDVIKYRLLCIASEFCIIVFITVIVCV